MSIICADGHENPDGAFFCETCGVLISTDSAAHVAVRICPRCGSPNQSDAQVCVQCDLELTAVEQLHSPDLDYLSLPTHPRLIVLADTTIFDLISEQDYIIGRADPTCDIFPDVDLTGHGGEDGGVSRIHAHLRFENGHYLIEDQKSINYTFLNKQRLEPYTPTVIKSGDELRLGRILLRFEVGP